MFLHEHELMWDHRQMEKYHIYNFHFNISAVRSPQSQLFHYAKHTTLASSEFASCEN